MKWFDSWFLDSIDMSGRMETDILGRLVEADWRVTQLSTALGNMTAAAIELDAIRIMLAAFRAGAKGEMTL